MSELFTKPMRKSGSVLRGLSPTIFHQAPLAQIAVGGISEGFGILDDFVSFNDESPWIVTNATSGTAILADAKGGVLDLDSAAAVDGQGVQIQYGGATGAASFVPNANAKIYFEARVKVTDIGTSGSDTCDLFVGLAEVDTTVVASGANSTDNHIGFEHVDDDGAVDFHSEKAGSRSSSSAVHTLSDGTYVKLGILVDGVSKITPFVNGVAGTAITTNVPIVALTPTLVCQSAGTTDPIMSVDFVACCQAEQIDN